MTTVDEQKLEFAKAHLKNQIENCKSGEEIAGFMLKQLVNFVKS